MQSRHHLGRLLRRMLVGTQSADGYDAETHPKSRTAALASGRPVFDSVGCGGLRLYGAGSVTVFI